MALNDRKITDSQINENGVISAPDKLTGTASENKAVFDKLIKQTVAPHFNGVIDDLASSGGSENIGTKMGKTLKNAIVSDDVQGIRLNSDKVIEVTTNGVDYEATGSSGHIIVDKNGVEAPQRSRIRFINSTVTDEDGETVVNGPKGDKGDIGSQGIQGIQGPDGKVYIPSINDDGIISWDLRDPSGVTPAPRNVRGPQGIQGVQGVQGEQGPAGPQGVQGIQGTQGPIGPAGKNGADGRSFTVLGLYPTFQDLIAEHPYGVNGDAWAVGTNANNTIYIWDTNADGWSNVGGLQGPQGPQGEQGLIGPAGPQGEQGIQGSQGIQGVQGERGVQGPEGPQGPQGNPTTVNGKSGASITLTSEDVGAFSLESFEELYMMIPTMINKAILQNSINNHPIGGIVINTTGTNPSEYLGFGTWETWGSGRVPVGVDANDGDFNTVEKTGGEKNHTTTINEMPNHKHDTTPYGITPGGLQNGIVLGTTASSGASVGPQGGGKPHNNLQPYITCYMWKRIA